MGSVTTSRPDLVNSKLAPSGSIASNVFASLTGFNNAGGAAAFGIGPVYIGGVQYWCDGATLKSDMFINVRAYGAKCDGIALYAATSTASATSTISDASASFSASDVGKTCALLSYVDVGVAAKYGTITSVIDSTHCVATLNSSPGALTGATLIYGTDDKNAIDAAIADASKVKGTVFIPNGICVTSGQHITPTGCGLRGERNFSTGGKAKDLKHFGSSLISVAYRIGSFLILGDTSGSDPKGVVLSDINIDGMNLCTNVLTTNTRTVEVRFCTLARAAGEVFITSPTGRVHNCCMLGSNVHNVIQGSGDTDICDNIITGAGATFYGIKLSNGDDVRLTGNHIWKDSTNVLSGGHIFLSFNSGSTATGSITISNNKFDTAFGPAIYIKASAASAGRGVSIVGNHAFNNDTVTNNSGSFINLEIQTGCTLRGLNIHSNILRGSFNDPTKGQWTSFLDATNTAGTVLASSVTGNIADNCNAGYTLFTPTYTAGNAYIAGSGTTVTAF